MPNAHSAGDLRLFRVHCPALAGNPGKARFQSGNVSNLLRFVANQQMSWWSANEDAMKRIIVVTAVLLGSALGAVAANAQLLRDSPQNLGDVPGNGAAAFATHRQDVIMRRQSFSPV